MELSEAGLEAARNVRGNYGSPRSVQSNPPSIAEIVSAYLEAAGDQAASSGVPGFSLTEIEAALEQDGYVVVPGPKLQVDGVREFANGTKVVTIKKRDDD